MRRKRQLTTFSLSFLDIMCCGFGAVVLVFLIIDHAADTQSEEVNRNLLAEVNLLEEDISEGKQGLVRLRNTLSELDMKMLEAQGLARRIDNEMENYRQRLNELLVDKGADKTQVGSLVSQIKTLENKVKKLREEGRKNTGLSARSFTGEGDRQYLTGLNLGGERVLILLDSSASMLDQHIVNIIRLRNMSGDIKRNSEKWKRSIATVQWLISQLPVNGKYQIYSFNTSVSSVIPNSMGSWLDVSNNSQLEDAVVAVKKIVPENGTSLENVLLSVLDFSPLPDNVFLITDGLPTQGARTPRKPKVTGQARLKLFEQAIEQLPNSIPFNVILAPLEGDPMAASAYWQLAQRTQGAFISPSRDWP